MSWNKMINDDLSNIASMKKRNRICAERAKNVEVASDFFVDAESGEFVSGIFLYESCCSCSVSPFTADRRCSRRLESCIARNFNCDPMSHDFPFTNVSFNICAELFATLKFIPNFPWIVSNHRNRIAQMKKSRVWWQNWEDCVVCQSFSEFFSPRLNFDGHESFRDLKKTSACMQTGSKASTIARKHSNLASFGEISVHFPKFN
jgi:hypothetical protein